MKLSNPPCFSLLSILTQTADTDVNVQSGNFVALYALTFFFANFGPNATTYILPSELFPARYITHIKRLKRHQPHVSDEAPTPSGLF